MGKSSGGIRNAGKNPRKKLTSEQSKEFHNAAALGLFNSAAEKGNIQNENSQKFSSEELKFIQQFNNMPDLKTFLDSRNEKVLKNKKWNYTQVQDVKKGDPFNLYELDKYISVDNIRAVFVTKNRGKYIYRDLQLKDVIKKK